MLRAEVGTCLGMTCDAALTFMSSLSGNGIPIATRGR